MSFNNKILNKEYNKMEIKHDESYLYLWNDMRETGLSYTTVGKICFQASNKIVTEIIEYLESKYRVYQYKKNNGVKHGTEDLFYWTNDRLSGYFDVTLKDDDTMEHSKTLAREVLEYAEQNYSETNLYIRVQYTEKYDWMAVNNYIETLTNDNIDLNVVRPLFSEIYHAGNKISDNNKEMLIKINKDYFDKMANKKVNATLTTSGIFGNSENIIIGKIKQIRNGEYGLFKLHATKTYYPVDLGSLKSLSII
jgi:hypothetical protein